MNKVRNMYTNGEETLISNSFIKRSKTFGYQLIILVLFIFSFVISKEARSEEKPTLSKIKIVRKGTECRIWGKWTCAKCGTSFWSEKLTKCPVCATPKPK